jgi:hydroxyacylglutathione hydrolase
MTALEENVRCLGVGMLEGNCFLVRCGASGEGAVIDPGDEGERIAEEAKAFGIRPEAVLLTHGHIDHTNAADFLRERFGAKVLCHALDAPMVRGEDGESLFGLERTPCEVDREVGDGEVIAVGQCRFRVLHTPGHTQGSVCYLLDGLIFSGDTLFKGSIGRTDLPGGSDHQMLESLNKRIAALDGKTVVYPGHGPATTIAHEKRTNPFLGALW